MNSNDTEPFLTVDELAAMLRVKPRFIYRLTSEGRIDYYRLGGRLRFRPRDVEAFLLREQVRHVGAPNVGGRPRGTGRRSP